MKILHIVNSLNTGGAEKLLVDSLPLYADYGLEVDLLLLNSTETPFLKKIKKEFKGKIFFSKVRSYYSPMQILEMKKYMKMDYDLVHAHLFPVLYWVSLAKILFRINKPIIFTEHSTGNKRLHNRLFRQIDKLVYAPYQKITAITPQVKEVLEKKLNIGSHKIEVIYNGINVKKYQNANAYPKSQFFNDDSKIIIQVSRFDGEKDQKTLIKALHLLPIEYKLLLVGDGSKKYECQKLVEELNISDRVLFLGIRMDVPELLKTCDIVVLSSNWEGFGLAGIEGMAAGKPVIVSNVEGLAQVVGSFGLTFEKGNEEELMSQILSLKEATKYNSFVDKSIIRAKEFDISVMIRENIKLYKTLTD